MKGCTVDRVHRRQTQLPRRQTSKNSRFGTVRMHDFRSILPQHPTDGTKCFPVLQRVQTAAQLRQYLYIQSPIASLALQRSLRPQPRPGNQTHLVPKQMMLIVHVEQGVLLGAPDNQASDDVRGSHAAEQGGPRPCEEFKRQRQSHSSSAIQHAVLNDNRSPPPLRTIFRKSSEHTLTVSVPQSLMKSVAANRRYTLPRNQSSATGVLRQHFLDVTQLMPLPFQKQRIRHR